MKTINDFLEDAKSITGSDYKTAQLMGVTRGSISNYRKGRSMPDQYAVFQLAEILKIDEVDLFICLGAEGEKNPAKKAYWEKRAGGFAQIWMMAGLVFFSGLILAAVSHPAYIADAVQVAYVNSVYYVK